MKTRREKILTRPQRYSGEIPQYSLGGILSSAAVGAGTGAIGGAGVLSAPGAIIGGAVGLATGLFEHFKEKKEERKQEKVNNALAQQSASVALSAGGAMNNYMSPWMAAKGGIVNGGTRVKLRNKEMLLGPDGSTATSEQLGINTPQHTNKGIVELEDGTVIVSPENSAQAKAIAAKQKPEVSKLNKVLNNPASTSLARKSAERRLAALKREYDPIIKADAERRMREGGSLYGGDMQEATLGTILKGVGKFAVKNKDALINGATTLAPMMYNIGQGNRSVEQLNAASFQNPMAYDALQSLSNRYTDINPALRGSEQAVAAADTNLRSSATGRGQYVAGRTALANADMTNRANIYSQAQKERNAYLGDYATAQMGIGQKMADTNLLISDLNARNQAAGRSFGATAVGQLSQWSQLQQQQRNQAAMEKMVMDKYSLFERLLSGDRDKTTGSAVTSSPAYDSSFSNSTTPKTGKGR